MAEITVNAEIRKELGKRAKRLRAAGKIPGIYYGHGQTNVPIAVSELALQPLYRTSAAHVINLKLDDGSTHMCVLRDVQFDPVTDRPLHFDLFGLNADEELTIEVPVKLVGSAKGVKEGGILQHVMHRVRVSCLPRNIPDHIEVNVEHLEINRSIHIRELSIPNVTIEEYENSTVVAVVPPTVAKEPAPGAVVAEAAPAEPEVIGKGKKAEEEGEGGEGETPASEKK